MRFCFLTASLTGREHLLNAFVESAKKSKYCDADYYLYFQEIDGQEKTGDFDRSFFKDIYISKTRDGACLPRMYWLERLRDYDFYVIIDDDMEFLGKENYETAMKFSEAMRDCGIVCTECFKLKKHYEKAVLKQEFKVDNIQWVRGGQIVKRSIRDLLVKEIDLKPFTFDAFSLVTYLNGYTNYLYLGSITLHKAGAKNGVEYLYKHSDEFTPFFEKFLMKTHDENGKLILFNKESELTEEARMLHEKNKKWC